MPDFCLKPYRIAVVFVALTVATFCLAAQSQGNAVVGYVFAQNNVLKPGDVDAAKLTRINYAFANIEDGRIVEGFAADKANFAALNTLKRENPKLTILVSVGGWLWSTHFSDVVLTAQSRTIFIQSVMEFLKRYDLDGLDIDWEYPGMPGAGHPYRKEDKENFTLLLKELRSRFHADTAANHGKLYLTIAAGASDEFLEHTEMAKAQTYLDTVNLMAYDYYEPGSDATTGHHAPLYTNPEDPKKVSADNSVQAFEKAGVPASKIVLGVPFYGHVWGQVPDHDHGLFQAGKPIPGAYASYQSIVATMLHNGFVRYWDPASSVPYLYDSQKQVFVSYEDPESLTAKCSYVKRHKLGGVMFWDYAGDPSGELLNTIHEALNPESRKAGATR
jgi:chitinase